jgi:hypothetical protein
MSRAAAPSLLITMLASGVFAGCFRFDIQPEPNAAPAALVAPVPSALVGAEVVLDGSGSSDGDGDALAYEWSQESGAPVQLRNARGAVASFTAPPEPGTFFFTLVVADGAEHSVPAVVRVDVMLPPNTAPVARADATEREVRPGQTVVLDGSSSSDADADDTLFFAWEVIEGAGGFVPLVDADKPVASFTAPMAEQTLYFRLNVNDGRESSPPVVVAVHVRLAPNTAPVAAADRTEQVVGPGATVVLDGSSSNDAEDDSLRYAWEQVLGSGEPVVLIDADKPVASFVAPSTEQRLFFRLVVSDGRVSSRPVVVLVDVQFIANFAPVLRVAHTELAAFTGANVVLDASATTDAENDPVFFAWTAIGESLDPVTLRDAGTAVASFTAPDRPQRLYFRVVANDGLHATAPVVVRVDVSNPPNAVPVAAVVLADQLVTTGATVVLDGSRSFDADDDALAFRWEQVSSSGDPVALNGANAAVASFVAPDRGQRLFFRLVVNDGRVDSLPLIVRVIVNAAPVALTGAPLEVANQGSVLVSGDAFDPDGDVIRGYRWRVTSAPTAGAACTADPSPCLFGADSPTVSFTPPAKGDYVLAFTVNDGLLESSPASYRVRSKNRPPVAAIGADVTAVLSGTPIALDSVASSDPDGDPIVSWSWTVTGLPSSGSARFTPLTADVAAPAITLVGRGNYFVSLKVEDVDGAESTVVSRRLEVLNSPPVANAGNDFGTQNGGEVAIQGRASDPDGDPLTYAWSLVDYPLGGRATLVDANQPSVRFTPAKRTTRSEPAQCQPGECYVLELVASDGLLLSVVDRVTVVSLNRAPVARAGLDQVNPASPVVLDGSASSDPDGDAIASWTWTQLNGPDVTGGQGALSGQTVSFRPPSGGTYVFDLRVTDEVATSAADRVVVSVDKSNEAPVLSLSRTRVVIDELVNAVGLDAGRTVDPDGDDFTVTWRRIAGSELLPATLAGEQPTFEAPSFNTLLESGDNTATYEVSATDGELASPPQRVVIAVAPGAGWVIVSPTATASDAGACGTRAQPCATPHRAAQLLDPDNNGAGDGRGILIASGNYRFDWSLNGVSVPGGTRVLGGRDPVTFARSTRSEMRFVQSCGGVRDAFFLGPNATNVAIEGLRVVNDNDCDGPDYTALRCNGCSATVTDSEFVQTDRLTNRAAAMIVNFAAANVTLRRVVLRASRATAGWIRGLYVLGGARVVAEDSDSYVTTVNNEPTAAFYVSDSRLILRRSRGEVSGSTNFAETTKMALFAEASTVSVESSVLVNASSVLSYGVSITGGSSVSILYSTIVGLGGTGSIGLGIRTTEALNLMGSIIADFPIALSLASAGALRSRSYRNAFLATGANTFSCNGALQTDSAVVNAAAGSACNASAEAWTGNLAVRCPLVNQAAGDYRLNTGITNPCVNVGLRATPAGVAPSFDFANAPRPADVDTLDLGAFESD